MDGINVLPLAVLPLAVTMMVGPQVMSAIIFVTAPRAVRVSTASSPVSRSPRRVGTAITFSIASAFDRGDPGDSGSSGSILQYVLVGLSAAAAIKN